MSSDRETICCGVDWIHGGINSVHACEYTGMQRVHAIESFLTVTTGPAGATGMFMFVYESGFLCLTVHTRCGLVDHSCTMYPQTQVILQHLRVLYWVFNMQVCYQCVHLHSSMLYKTNVTGYCKKKPPPILTILTGNLRGLRKLTESMSWRRPGRKGPPAPPLRRQQGPFFDTRMQKWTLPFPGVCVGWGGVGAACVCVCRVLNPVHVLQ